MPRKLKRHHDRGDLHFVTFSCYERRALLGTVRARDLFVKILEQVRRRWAASVVGYAVMPEHVHLLSNLREKNRGEKEAHPLQKPQRAGHPRHADN